jgi:glycosyltransferase involved in cell wall biosynthesis
MKVAILISELLVEGGGERQPVHLAAELQGLGHEAVIFTTAWAPESCYPSLRRGLRVVESGRHPLNRLPLPLPARLRDLLDMRHLARAVGEGFDVLNPHAWPAHWAAVAASQRLADTPPVVWMCNDYLWPEYLFQRRPWWDVHGRLRQAWRRWLRRYDQGMVENIGRTVVLDGRMTQSVREGYGVDSVVVRSGAAPHEMPAVPLEDTERLRRELGLHGDDFLLLFLGILMPHRRLEDALKALPPLTERGRRIHFLVVGSRQYDRRYSRFLEEQAKALGIGQHVTFGGAVPEASLPLYYNACDAFIFPNENQTWGLAVIEAMACGRPVIVSTGCGVSEVVTDGVNALLVPPRRPDRITLCLKRLMDDADLRRSLGEEGRRLVETELSWRRYAEKMLAVFEEAARQGEEDMKAVRRGERAAPKAA